MWPADDPPKPALHTTLAVQNTAAPATHFAGPLNVLAALHYAQAAAVTVDATRDAYQRRKDE